MSKLENGKRDKARKKRRTEDARSTKPQISFADGSCSADRVGAVLQNISDFFDDHKELIEPVRPDLQRGFENPGLVAAD